MVEETDETTKDRYMLFSLVFDTLLDIAYFSFLAVVVVGLYRSFKFSPIYVALSIMFCLTTTIHIIGDIGLNYLLLRCLLDRSMNEICWDDPLSMVVGGMKLFARFYLVLLQAVMTTNRFCAIVFVTKYYKIFTMKKTIIAATLLFTMALPSFPFYAFGIDGCVYMFTPPYLAWVYTDSICRDIHEISLITVNCVIISAVISVDLIALVLLWAKRQKGLLPNLDFFWSELQFIVVTVVLGVLTAISITLRTALDGIPISEILINYMQKLVDVVLSLVSIIAIGFINRKVRCEILKTMRICKSHNATHSSSTVLVRPLCEAGYAQATSF